MDVFNGAAVNAMAYKAWPWLILIHLPIMTLPHGWVSITPLCPTMDATQICFQRVALPFFCAIGVW